MHSKWPYKICIYSVILGELESLRSGFQDSLFENSGYNLTYYECENFSGSPLHHIFESENFSFRFSTKIA